MTPQRKQISGNVCTEGEDLIKTMILWNERIQYDFKIICSEYKIY